MLTYTAHRKPDLLDQANDGSDIVFIKDGFSWPGLLIPFFWMIWHRLWLPLAVYLAAVALLALAGHVVFSLPDGLMTSLGLLLNLFVGLEGNNFWRRALAKRGFEEIADIVADNSETASYRFFSTRLSDQNG